MKGLPLLIVFVLAASVSGQVSLDGGLQVNGIGLGADHKAVIKKFGKPSSDTTARQINECTGTHIRTVRFPGLKIELDDAAGGFKVFSFEITSGTYDVSGVKIGDAAATVEKRFGKRGRTTQKEKNGPVWLYPMSDDNPGASVFYFQNGKLNKIQTTYEMC